MTTPGRKDQLTAVDHAPCAVEIVVVAGAPRSGKSSLCALFDSHPDVLAWPLQMSLTAALDADLRAPGSGAVMVAREVERHARLLAERGSTFFESLSIDGDRRQALTGALRGAANERAGSSLEALVKAASAVAGVLDRTGGRVVALIDARVRAAVLSRSLAAGDVGRAVVLLRHPAAVYRELRRKHFIAHGYGDWGSAPRPLLPSLIDHLREYDGSKLCRSAPGSALLCVSCDDVIGRPGPTAGRVAEWLGIDVDWPQRDVRTRFGQPALLDRTRGEGAAANTFSIERRLIDRTFSRLSPAEEYALAQLAGDPVGPPAWSLLPGELWALAKAPWRAFTILSTGRANRRGTAAPEGEQG